MKIALVHDYIKEYGGAERVLETLHEMYPTAPVFTLVYCPEFLGPHTARFKNWDIRPSLLQYIPLKHKLISIFRLFAPFIFPLFRFGGYDIVIVSATGAYSPNLISKESAKQICYYHTPPRYLYGLPTAREWKKNPIIRILAGMVNIWLRSVDKNSSQNVDICIANSQTVKKRIKKFYDKEAIVVYPPVDVVGESGKKENYYLAGGRLARPKHIDLIIQVANELHLPLKIFGKGFAGYGKELEQLAGPTIEFLGEVSDEKKQELMMHAQAFFMASEEEDFGIVPVEAMGVGTPVIAYKSGGLTETIVEGKTGVFFEELIIKSIIAAVKRFEDLRQRRGKKLAEDCILQAEKFSKHTFEKEINTIVHSV